MHICIQVVKGSLLLKDCNIPAQMSHCLQYLIQYLLAVCTLNVILLSTGGTNASCHSRWKILECGLVLSLCVQISAQTGAPYDICSGTFDDYFSNLCTSTPPPIVSILCSAVFVTCTVVCLHMCVLK